MKNLEKELYNRVDQILFYKWDPIGVSDVEDANVRDEYSSYVEGICSAVLQQETKEQIVERLVYIETVTMGLDLIPSLPNDTSHHEMVADAILSAYHEIYLENGSGK